MNPDDLVHIFIAKVETLYLPLIAELQRDSEDTRFDEPTRLRFLEYISEMVENAEMFFALDELPHDRELRVQVTDLVGRLRAIRAWVIAHKPNPNRV